MGSSTPPICSAALASLKPVPTHETKPALTIIWRLVIVWPIPPGRPGVLDLTAHVRTHIAFWRGPNAQHPTLDIDAPDAQHRAREADLHQDIPDYPHPLNVGGAHMHPVPYVAPGRLRGPSPLPGSLIGTI